jgi:6-pyruvoyltetrahydropterin/6-carboxytetrahydropterin synthase
MAATELIYQSSKTYQHSAGFSCVFRQWKATSHCNQIHGYALKIELVFEGELDERNWVQDFGGLKATKEWIASIFDHKTVVAADDPHLDWFQDGAERGIVDLIVLDAVGCEKFAELIFRHIDELPYLGTTIQSVQVWEHEANSAKVIRKSSVHMDWFQKRREMSPEEYKAQFQQEPIPDEVPLDNNGKHF